MLVLANQRPNVSNRTKKRKEGIARTLNSSNILKRISIHCCLLSENFVCICYYVPLMADNTGNGLRKKIIESIRQRGEEGLIFVASMMQDTSLNIERTRDENICRRIVVTARGRLVEGTKSTSEDRKFVWINRSNSSIPRSVLFRRKTTRQFFRLFWSSKGACKREGQASGIERANDFDNCLQELGRSASKCWKEKHVFFDT